MRNQGIYYFNSHNDHETYINSKDYKEPYVCYDQQHIHYNKKIDYSKEYFTIEALESGTIKAYIDYYYSHGNGDIYYSFDKSTWTSISEYNENSQYYTNINVIKNQKIYFKGNYVPNTMYNVGGLKISTDFKFNVSGNILSLRYDNFQNQEYLMDPSKLITSSSDSNWNNCWYEHNGVRYYRSNYSGDQNEKVFSSMFKDNTNLISAGNLVFSMKHVCKYAFSSMFSGCTSLVDFPQFITNMVCWGDPFENMFYGCTSLKKVEKFSPIFASPINDNGSNIYCNYMFSGCTSLNYVKCLMTNPYESGTSKQFNMINWLFDVSQTGTFVKRSGVYWPTGNNGIPSGWTVKNV